MARKFLTFVKWGFLVSSVVLHINYYWVASKCKRERDGTSLTRGGDGERGNLPAAAAARFIGKSIAMAICYSTLIRDMRACRNMNRDSSSTAYVVVLNHTYTLGRSWAEMAGINVHCLRYVCR